MIEFINSIVAEIGKPKKEFQSMELDHDLFEAVKAEFLDDFKAAMDTDDKNVRDMRLLPIRDRISEKYGEEWGEPPSKRSCTKCRSSWFAAGFWTRASAWTAVASTRSVRWPPKLACCPVYTVPACSPAARRRSDHLHAVQPA